MRRKRKFVVGRCVRRSTMLVMLRPAISPIRGPWLVRAVVYATA
jgi:hypothetical protein